MKELLFACFQLLKFTPNKEQERAITHSHGPLFIKAAPGSGKTRVLLWRVVYLIVCLNVEPRKIFISTFTTDAAKQLRNGLNQILEAVHSVTGKTYDLSEMYIGTVHSLCQRMLSDRRFSKKRERLQAPVLMDDVEQYLFIRGMWKEFVKISGTSEKALKEELCEFFHSYRRTKKAAIECIISLFNRWSEETLTLSELRTHTAGLPILDKIVSFYEFYLSSLEEGNVPKVDFSLLQQATLQLLFESERSIHEFEHVLVDEYQDSNVVQELIFFRLAKGSKNICVVGDDDQSLYRFRGATVEGFTEFPMRCEHYLDRKPTEITLNINYRSKKMIVNTYDSFMRQKNWTKPDGIGSYRIVKDIQAHSKDTSTSVIASSHTSPNEVAEEIAQFVKALVDSKKVEDPNQIAVLFPSLKSVSTLRLQEAIEHIGLEVYAPRANHFFEGDIALVTFGLYLRILGRPQNMDLPGDYQTYQNWLDRCEEAAGEVLASDPTLQAFIEEKRNELHGIKQIYKQFEGVLQEKGWSSKDEYEPAIHEHTLRACLVRNQKQLMKGINKTFQRRKADERSFTLSNVINRITSVDWSVLDLFYHLWQFSYFKEIKDLATRSEEDIMFYQLRQISMYLARFMERYNARILYGSALKNETYSQLFFASYLYSLFLMRETEFEDKNNPFPKGKIPFLTCHQAKGLEFPVVILGSVSKKDMGPPRVEEIVRPMLDRQLEPIDEVSSFDAMRMFYVALSRAKSLLVIAQPRGRGIATFPAFKQLLNEEIVRIPDFDIQDLEIEKERLDEMPKVYSFTSDFLLYKKCPHLYMVSRKYDFVPSRSQTMFYGSLVHRTIEDLHNRIMFERGN